MSNYLTRQGLNELQDELKKILETELPVAVESIEAALKQGDLRENAELNAAKELRESLLLRQGEIEAILSDYELIEDSTDVSVVRIGSKVTVDIFNPLNNTAMIRNYRIVGSSEANPENLTISDESPLGAALLGKKVNISVKYKAPVGLVSAKILKIE